MREPRRENLKQREEDDADVEGKVRGKDTAGDKREDFDGRRTLEEEMRVVEEAIDAIDMTLFSLCDWLIQYSVKGSLCLV